LNETFEVEIRFFLICLTASYCFRSEQVICQSIDSIGKIKVVKKAD